jgi:hypothetical protein
MCENKTNNNTYYFLCIRPGQITTIVPCEPEQATLALPLSNTASIMKYLLSFAVVIWSMGAKAQTRKDFIGCWTMPGLIAENLSLDSEGNFFFNDYHEYTRSFEPLFGTWKLKGNVLILMYDEQKQIRFKIQVTAGGVWMLVKPGRVRLVKAKPEDCEKQ